jgi:hypothetical protein
VIVGEEDLAHPERCFIRKDPREVASELIERLGDDTSELLPVLTVLQEPLHSGQLLRFHSYLGAVATRRS